MASSPIDQFQIKQLIPIENVAGFDLSYTNSALVMTIAVVAITTLMLFGMRRRALVPGRFQSCVELSYEFIAGMVRDNVGNEGRPFFPFIFTLFMFILFGNMLGMIPYSFTFTSHIIVTFGLAMMVFIGTTIIGFVRHGTHFFSLFFPPGAPKFLAPLMIPIELISYLSRPVSLSVRLFANMMAGHTMLKVFAGFSVSLPIVLDLFPLGINVALHALEILIALLQAYVFAVLSCLYLHDAVHLH